MINRALFLLVAACGSTTLTPSKPVCADLRAKDLIITELMIDPDGADPGGEWVELFNRSAYSKNLEGLTLSVRDPMNAEKSVILKSGAIASQRSFTVGDSKQTPLPAWLDQSYGTALGSLPQAGAHLSLRCGELVIDEVQWSDAPKPGRSRMLDPNGSTWCDAPVDAHYDAVNSGTPDAPNPICIGPASCLGDDGVRRERVSPVPGSVHITEVMAAPHVANSAVGQWFEVFASQDADLNGLTVITSTGASSLDDERCLRVSAGQFALLARSSDPFVNGGLPAPLGRFTGSLSSNNERLGLFSGDSGIDDIAFYKSSTGISWQRNTELTGGGPDAFCLATQAWPDGGGDFGTPAAPNTPCATPLSTTTCLDPSSRFAREIVSPAPGGLVITEVMADPTAAADELGEWFEVRANTTFDLNGVSLGNEGTATSSLATRSCRAIDAGTFLLFARNANASLNGGLPPVDGVFTFSLGNSGSRVVRVMHDGTELARFDYASTTPGVSLQRDPGSGQQCLTPPTQHSGGTPGQPNLTCP